jgi:hypothetical protein
MFDCQHNDVSANGGKAEAVMDRYVARLNIDHYRAAIADEKDEQRRSTLARLLAEEEARLAAAEEKEKRRG